MLVLAAPLLAAPLLAAPLTDDLGERLARAEIRQAFAGVGEPAVLDASGEWLAFHAGGRARVFSPTTLRFADLSALGDARARGLAFSPDGGALWVGTVDGRIVRCPLAGDGGGGSAPRVDPVAEAEVTALAFSPDGTLLAWHAARTDTAGLLDVESGATVARFDDVRGPAFGHAPEPPLAFTPDGSHLVVGQGRGYVLWNVATGAVDARVDPYVTEETNGFAFAAGGLYFARRAGGVSIRRMDLASFEVDTLDPDARSIHFVDLFASPSGAWLAEGDFEDRGAVVYELASGARHAFGGKDARPLGFYMGEAELLLTGGERDRGLVAWTPRGERVAELAALAGRRVTRAFSTPDGRRVIALCQDVDDERTVEHQLLVLAVDPPE